MSNLWNLDDVSSSSIATFTEETVTLARRAYDDGDLAARARAEAILYKLNIENCFAPPLHTRGAIAWTTLMHHKVIGLRRQYGGCEPITTAEMRTRLLAAVEKWGAFTHPLLGHLRASASDLSPYRIWAKNWFGSCVGFSSQLAALVQRTSGEAKQVVIENLSDEFNDKVTHDVLRTRFYESLGLTFSAATALDDPDRVLEATELLNARTALSYLRDPVPAFGCFFGVEANWPPECRLHLDINRARGADEHVLEYWTGHATTDDHHSAEWLVAIEKMCRSDEERALAVDGAVIQLRLRWTM
ncbi:MAG TPA: iron-containing redox enzyme family protein [Kofleriaceae bacterium]